MVRALPPVNAVTDDALGDDDAWALRQRLTRGEVTAGELWQAARQRAEAVESTLNGIACWVDESATPGHTRPPDRKPPDPEPPDRKPPDRKPRGSDPPLRDSLGSHQSAGGLAGIPCVVKDNEDLAGHPTRQGSRAVPSTSARTSTPIVAALLDLGLTPVAKTTLPEFGLTASTESSLHGATRNPWSPSHSVGGSSGGSAALVAAGVVPIGHANDGGGSIRIPAACCGLVGLKPSRGRLPDRPEVARLPVPIVAQGVLTRSVRDTAMVLAEMERHHPARHLPPIGAVVGPAHTRLRVGVLRRAPHAVPVDPDVIASVDAVATALEHLGHHVEPIDPPVDEQFARDFLAYWQLLAFLLYRGGRVVEGSGFDAEGVEAFTRYLSRRLGQDVARVPGALRRLRRHARTPEPVFDDVDVVLSPVLAHPPPPIGYLGPDVDPQTHLVRLLRWVAFTAAANVTGAPALALPAGRGREGLPIGVQLSAARGRERRLLELAFELDGAVD